MIRRMIILSLLFFTLYTLHFTQVYAEEKIWSGAGDGSSWSDEDNWSPTVVPTDADGVLIDVEDASLACTETFEAKSITIGGRETSQLTSNNFIFGIVLPASVSAIAILNRRGGTLTLKGAGTLTVRGQYKDSEEALGDSPSFMFWVK